MSHHKFMCLECTPKYDRSYLSRQFYLRLSISSNELMWRVVLIEMTGDKNRMRRSGAVTTTRPPSGLLFGFDWPRLWRTIRTSLLDATTSICLPIFQLNKKGKS